MRLRPHHGLCIRYFTGKGYSPAFVANMTRLIDALHAEPETEIELADGADVLCACCPHNQNGRCESSPKPSRYDLGVLRLCGLKTGDRLPWWEFQQRVEEQILSADLLTTICSGCQWFPICEKQQNEMDNF